MYGLQAWHIDELCCDTGLRVIKKPVTSSDVVEQCVTHIIAKLQLLQRV